MDYAKAVGIDLGTTNSAVAYLDPTGRSKMVANTEGDLLTPSIVLFEDSEVVVGKQARGAASVHPERVAEWVKLDMGKELYSRPIRGEFLPPEVIQACILRKLKTDILEEIGSAPQVVITVPAYFDEPRRTATATAGEMAGLSVLDIVNEPTAAALAFGETLGYLGTSGVPDEETTVLVYDLGGGTFDVTLLHLAPGDIRTLATDGDVRLGGHDWDLRLVDYVADAFEQAHGIDPRENPAAMNRLFDDAAEAKKTLSVRSRAIVRVEHEDRLLDVTVTRDDFDDMTADLLERTSYTCRQLLRDASVDWADVDRILLVGGSTRMPMISRLLESLSGKRPVRNVNPDEAVARGAALYAGYLLGKGRAEPTGFDVTNVNSHSLGMAGVDPTTGRRVNKILIRRNTPLPVKVTKQFMTGVDDQRSIVIQVLEGESPDPEDCTAVGRSAIRDLPPGLSQGTPVEVTFEYGTNGRLTVEAIVPGTYSGVSLALERDTSLSNQRIAEWTEIVERAGAFDDFEEEASSYITPPPEPPAESLSGEPNRFAAAPTPPAGGETRVLDNPLNLPDSGAGVGDFVLATSVDDSAGGPVAEEPGMTIIAPGPPAENSPPPAPNFSDGGQGYATLTAGAVSERIGPPGAWSGSGNWDEREDTYDRPTRDQLRMIRGENRSRGRRRWMVYVIGYLLSAAIGLGAGYLIIVYFFPQVGLPRPW